MLKRCCEKARALTFEPSTNSRELYASAINRLHYPRPLSGHPEHQTNPDNPTPQPRQRANVARRVPAVHSPAGFDPADRTTTNDMHSPLSDADRAALDSIHDPAALRRFRQEQAERDERAAEIAAVIAAATAREQARRAAAAATETVERAAYEERRAAEAADALDARTNPRRILADIESLLINEARRASWSRDGAIARADMLRQEVDLVMRLLVLVVPRLLDDDTSC